MDGVPSEALEELYRAAVRVTPTDPSCQSRLVCYLVAQARNDDARAAWDGARIVLESAPPERLYREFHLCVIRILLQRGQLDFAKELLNTIPGSCLAGLPELDTIANQYEAQLLAQTHGALVPTPVLLPGWWVRGPFVLSRELRSGYRLTRWCAGRVETVQDGKVTLRMAFIEPPAVEMPSVHQATIEADTLKGWGLHVDDLEVGGFIEVGTYANAQGGTQERAALHRRDFHPM